MSGVAGPEESGLDVALAAFRAAQLTYLQKVKSHRPSQLSKHTSLPPSALSDLSLPRKNLTAASMMREALCMAALAVRTQAEEGQGFDV